MSPGHKMKFTGRLPMPRWLPFIMYPPCSEYIDMGNDKQNHVGMTIFSAAQNRKYNPVNPVKNLKPYRPQIVDILKLRTFLRFMSFNKDIRSEKHYD